MKKILLIGSQHGNERLGDHVMAYINTHAPELLEHVDFIIGNPKAYEQNIRYTETDLNRSYGLPEASYEVERASEITRYIERGEYNLIVDLHTTTCDMGPCFISGAAYNDEVRAFMSASDIDKLVLLPAEICQYTLIGTEPASVAVEINTDESELSAPRVVAALKDYLAGHAHHEKKTIYPVIGKIMKSETTDIDTSTFVNYEHHEALGAIPILVGENSYKKNTDYLGFKAGQTRHDKV